MRLRPATSEDAAGIAAIWNPAIRDTLVTFNSVEKSAEDVAALIATNRSAGHAFLVVEEDGIAGFAYYTQFRGGAGYRHSMENTIHLATGARGRGIGRRLMTALEDAARGRGAHVMVAGVSGGNPDGRAFHAALGYAEVAVLPEVGRKFDRWLDLHLMVKRLDAG